MTCWVAEYPEVVFADSVGHAGSAEAQHISLRRLDVVDFDVEVELLRSSRVRELRRLVFGWTPAEASELFLDTDSTFVHAILASSVVGAAWAAGLLRHLSAGYLSVHICSLKGAWVPAAEVSMRSTPTLC